MAGALADRYRRWYDYERDAHAKVLASLQRVPAGGREADWFHRAVDLFAHMAAARRLWLHRLGAAAQGPAEIFPRGVLLDDLAAEWRGVEAEWTVYLGRLDDAELGRDFAYRSTEGDRYRSRVEDILTQLFGHSWYHRGQIAQLLRSGGAEPAPTDFVFWTREPLDA